MQRLAPEIADLVEEEIPGTGHWRQRFTLVMPGDPWNAQPFDRVGVKLDLADPQVRVNLWRTLRDDRFDDGA